VRLGPERCHRGRHRHKNQHRHTHGGKGLHIATWVVLAFISDRSAAIAEAAGFTAAAACTYSGWSAIGNNARRGRA